MNITLIVPYPISESGITVFGKRLSKSLNNLGIHTVVFEKGNSIVNNYDKKSRIYRSISNLEDLLFQDPVAEFVIWLGFFHEKKEVQEQIDLSIKLRTIYRKRVYFLWERTGFDKALPKEIDHNVLISKGCDGLFVLNYHHYKSLRKMATPKNLLNWISPGVDTKTEYLPVVSLDKKNKIRALFNISTNDILLLSVSRFTRRKRIDFLIRTWLEDPILQKFTSLLLVGSGFDQKDSIEVDIKKLAASNKKIKILPHKGEESRVKYYQASDIFLATGILEGEPSSLSEAMACGLPIVASNIAGHKYLVQQNNTGLLFQPDNGNSLIQALHTLIGNSSQRLRLGKVAREKAIKEREISVIAINLLDILRNNRS